MSSIGVGASAAAAIYALENSSDENKITSIQGKKFEYEDILLFKREDKRIIVIFNDTEQIKKFVNEEGKPPVAILPYTEQTYKKVVREMKPIRAYTQNEMNSISVQYDDETCISFSLENKEIIENNYIEQKRMKVKSYKVRKIEKYEDMIKNDKIDILGNYIFLIASLAIYVLSMLVFSNQQTKFLMGIISGVLTIEGVIDMFKTVRRKTNLEIDLNKLKEDLENGLNNENEKSRGCK